MVVGISIFPVRYSIFNIQKGASRAERRGMPRMPSRLASDPYES